jgi:hypothetical protein
MHLETTGFDLDASESALIDFARAIEQASHRAALEGCAKALADDYKSPQFLSPVTVLDCVDFIRALAKETNNG